MGSNPATENPKLCETMKEFEQNVRLYDEARWLSSCYAAPRQRNLLTLLYAFNLELARIRLSVSEAHLGFIRFQWWRDQIAKLGDPGAAPKHPLLIALSVELSSALLTREALLGLVDGHETAFEQDDRALEPEGELAILAANLLMPGHGWDEEIRSLADEWSGLRRGAAASLLQQVPRVPHLLRPAISHFRLRRLFSRSRNPNALARRGSILWAVLTGRI